MNWRKAYLAQAWSDYEVFRKLNSDGHPLCHKLHYLQMATEKLAKGFLCNADDPPPKKTHFVLVRFLQVSKHRPEWVKRLGYEGRNRVYASIVDNLLPLAERIEKLAPVGGDFDRINPEYPWMDSGGKVICPAAYSFPDFRKRELTTFLTLISSLFSIIGFK